MDENKGVPQTIDEYIAGFSPDVQAILSGIRQVVREAAPEAQEAIRYKMPAFNLEGRYLVYFSAFKKHIGFYPAFQNEPDFAEELASYQSGRGTLQFPNVEPVPYALIRKIVQARAQENRQAAAKTATPG